MGAGAVVVVTCRGTVVVVLDRFGTVVVVCFGTVVVVWCLGAVVVVVVVVVVVWCRGTVVVVLVLGVVVVVVVVLGCVVVVVVEVLPDPVLPVPVLVVGGGTTAIVRATTCNGALGGWCASEPSGVASPNWKTRPVVVASQYPLPSGVGAIPTKLPTPCLAAPPP
jgi:hypothetical protein